MLGGNAIKLAILHGGNWPSWKEQAGYVITFNQWRRYITAPPAAALTGGGTGAGDGRSGREGRGADRGETGALTAAPGYNADEDERCWAYLAAHISPELRHITAGTEGKSLELWTRLEQHFVRCAKPALMQHKSALYNIMKKRGETMMDYLGRADGLRGTLAMLDNPISDFEHKFLLWQGIINSEEGSKYLMATGGAAEDLITDAKITPYDLITTLTTKEYAINQATRRNNPRDPRPDAMRGGSGGVAFYTGGERQQQQPGRSSRGPKCWRCHQYGHVKTDCPRAATAPGSGRGRPQEKICDYCNLRGHTAETCYKKKRDNMRTGAPGTASYAVAFAATGYPTYESDVEDGEEATSKRSGVEIDREPMPETPYPPTSAASLTAAWRRQRAAALITSESCDFDYDADYIPLTDAGEPETITTQESGFRHPGVVYIPRIGAKDLLNAQYDDDDEDDIPVAITLCATGDDAMAHSATSFKYTSGGYDPSDWMLERIRFNELDTKYGPFDMDGAADADGNNAQLDFYCFKEGASFLDHKLDGLNIWCNPPFKSIKTFLNHYLECKKRDWRTSAVWILPYEPSADWWPLTAQMTEVRHWPAGTQLFTMPGPGGVRRTLRPCPFPVVAMRDEPGEPGNPLSTVFSVKDKLEPCGTYILDSGATAHMTPYASTLIHLRPPGPKDPSVIYVGNGKPLRVTAVGTLTLTSNAIEDNICFMSTLLVPELKQPLISLGAITAGGAKGNIDSTGISITYKDRIVLRATKRGGVFELNGCRPVNMVTGRAFAATTNDNAFLWHRRLGHLGFKNCARVPGITDGVDTSPSDFHAAGRDNVCGDCLAGRQQREPRVSDSPRSTERLERLYVDLAGPFPEVSIDGERFYLIIVDEATSYTWVEAIASKDRAADMLHYIVKTETARTGQRVRYIRSDGGGEFISNELIDKWTKLGIEHETTVRYSPESNGVAERANRAIMEKARSMLSDAQAPSEFWGHAVAHAAMLRNLSPTANAEVTPWELYTGHRPDLKLMRVWGCLCYCHVPDDLRTKLDPKTEKGMLVGVSLMAKKYGVIIDGLYQVRRDVKFDESVAAYPLLYPADDDGLGRTSERADPSYDPYSDPGYSPTTSTEAQPSGTEEAADNPESGPSDAHVRRSARLAGMPAQAFSASADQDPTTYEEAMASEQRDQWHEAMIDENQALVGNNTWTLVRAPPGAKVLPNKWVLRKKLNADGTVQRYKARLVVGGHRQRNGIDYDEIDLYAKCANIATLRIMLAVAAANDYELHSIDISNAFLNADLHADVYMRQPEGFGNGDSTLVCKLNKTLYGLRQSPKEWYDLLSSSLRKLGYTASDSDAALWKRASPAGFTYILFWVDDLLIMGPTKADVTGAKSEILAIFKGRDLGEPTSYLGISIARNRAARTITLSQGAYEQGVLERFGMTEAHPKTAPISTGADYTIHKEGDVLLDAATPYREAVGALLYLSYTTRPDLAVATSILARGMTKPCERLWVILKGVLRYVKGTTGRGITYGRSTTPIEVWTDADYAACKDTRRSRSGFICNVYGGAACWRTTLQTVVALSSAESEYIAAFYAARECTWLKRLCSDLGIPLEGAVPIKADNTAAIKMASNAGDSSRTKHIDVGYHFLREKVASGTIRMVQCSTDDNVADAFTKPLAETKLNKFILAMGMG